MSGGEKMAGLLPGWLRRSRSAPVRPRDAAHHLQNHLYKAYSLSAEAHNPTILLPSRLTPPPPHPALGTVLIFLPVACTEMAWGR